MDLLKEYNIPFVGLSLGSHNFDYKIDEVFFSYFDYSEIEKGIIDVELIFNKEPNLLILNFELKGWVSIMCDRCLDYFNAPINNKFRLIVKFGSESYEETDEIIILTEKEHQINVAQYIYEYILLSLPFKKVHPDDEKGKSTCNKEFLKKIKEYSVKQRPLNTDEINDSRWDILKDINFEDDNINN